MQLINQVFCSEVKCFNSKSNTSPLPVCVVHVTVVELRRLIHLREKQTTSHARRFRIRHSLFTSLTASRGLLQIARAVKKSHLIDPLIKGKTENA